MFAIVEFSDKEGGGLSLINSRWLTPRKKEVLWPPIRDSLQFNRILRDSNHVVDTETWKTYEISRIFYECGKFNYTVNIGYN